MKRINVKSRVKEKCELIVIIFNKELYKDLKKETCWGGEERANDIRIQRRE